MKWTYSLVDDQLVVKDIITDATVWQGKPEGYPVETIVPLVNSDDCIVLYHYMSGHKRFFQNLVRCRHDGTIVWRAELPDAAIGDVYVSVGLRDGQLVANSWSCYLVVLDPETGQILSTRFTK
jgi:outer membrane protein assembly factor BamB